MYIFKGSSENTKALGMPFRDEAFENYISYDRNSPPKPHIPRKTPQRRPPSRRNRNRRPKPTQSTSRSDDVKTTAMIPSSDGLVNPKTTPKGLTSDGSENPKTTPSSSISESKSYENTTTTVSSSEPAEGSTPTFSSFEAYEDTSPTISSSDGSKIQKTTPGGESNLDEAKNPKTTPTFLSSSKPQTTSKPTRSSNPLQATTFTVTETLPVFSTNVTETPENSTLQAQEFTGSVISINSDKYIDDSIYMKKSEYISMFAGGFSVLLLLIFVFGLVMRYKNKKKTKKRIYLENIRKINDYWI